MTDPREEKLPRWARALLAEERRAARDARDKLDEHLKTVERSRIWYGDYDNKIYVPEPFGYQTIHMNPYGDGEFYHDVQFRIKDRHIEVSGGDSLSVDMRVSNLFDLRTAR